MQPATRMQSEAARYGPQDSRPRGTDPNTASHKTMLIADPAVAIDQPRSTSIDGPKLKINAKPTL